MKKDEQKVEKVAKNGTVVIQCQGQCRPHRFQDGKYGQGRRVHNLMKSGGMRCTVCGNVIKPK